MHACTYTNNRQLNDASFFCESEAHMYVCICIYVYMYVCICMYVYMPRIVGRRIIWLWVWSAYVSLCVDAHTHYVLRHIQIMCWGTYILRVEIYTHYVLRRIHIMCWDIYTKMYLMYTQLYLYLCRVLVHVYICTCTKEVQLRPDTIRYILLQCCIHAYFEYGHVHVLTDAWTDVCINEL